ncbi:MAG: rod shape-determining protein RodA [Atopobiaceae bacterium]|nr:rod shape-determining protein RodA [Atopobiaceae bacterium]
MALDSSAVTKRRIVSPFRKKAGIPSGGLAKKDKITGKNILNNLYLAQLVPTALLVLIGIVVIWTASLNIPEASFPRHLLGIALGIICAILMWRYDYRGLANMTNVLIVTVVVLMVLPRVPGFGVSVKGMTGWVNIPFIGFRFQPSELGKIVTIFLMASVCAQYNGKVETLKDYIKLCGTLMVPFGSIMLLPDLGTGLIILVIGATVIICSGAKKSWILVTLLLLIVVVALVVVSSMIPGFPHILKDYQMKRLTVFLDPSVDPSGDGYNLQQAKIAVGSGGFIGKGPGNATQASGRFLPEAHTDFVFALFAEEFGFLGALIMLLLFAWMIFATIFLAMKTESTFSKLVLVGCSAMWTFQVLQNVGMCIGIMPITGIPLPFISFGSTSMIAQLTAVGVVQSVYRHRTKAA